MSAPAEIEVRKKPVRAGLVLRNYAEALKNYPWLVVASFAFGIAAEIASVAAPVYLKNLVNALTSLAQSAESMPVLFGILAMFAFVLAIRSVGYQVQGRVSSQLESRVMVDLSNTAFSHLMGHSHDFFISNFAGALTRRVNRYSGAFEQIFDTILFNFFGTAIFALGAIAVLFERNAALGLALLFWLILIIFVQIALVRWKQPLRVASAEQDTRVTAVLSDAVSNHSTVAQFAANTYEHSLFNDTMGRWRDATLRSWLGDVQVNGILGVINVILQVGLLAGAIVLWARGFITIGDFLLIQIYVLGLIDRVWGLGRSMRRLYSAFADAQEMIVILETPHGVEDAPDAKPLVVSEGKIEMEDVRFGFIEREVLKSYSLSIAPGEKIALVGPSGAGKSTITKLLLRMYDVSSGSIRIDGQDISQVTQESLRAAIAFVPQEPLLFHRTLMENIRYGRRDATDDEVMEAAKKARCHDFIAQLPQGYDTYVGERGVKLSGGERQRVAIARALLKNAPILILDEATSSLDSESEALIQEALEILMEGKTVVVIAHRLSTIMHMDRIVVMEQGRIAAEGTHAELLDQHGSLYHKLWSIQAGSFIADA